MLNKFREYFSIVNHPYRYYALLFTIIFSSTIAGNALAGWLSS